MKQGVKSPVKKRSTVINGQKTSISLEDAFWEALHDIAHKQRTPISHLINLIAQGREHNNLSSAVRVFILRHYQGLAEG